MQHLSNEVLDALALGHDEAGGEHLEGCAQCRAEVASLRETAERYRRAAVAPTAPPAGLWQRIADEVDVDGRERSEGVHSAGAPADRGAPAGPRSSSAAEPPHVAPRRRRRFSAGALVAASLASAALAATIAVVVVGQLGAAPRSTDLAGAVLEPLESGVPVAAARAEVVERDGQRLLLVDADELPEVDGYLDVWLLDAQAQQMVSLGVMDAATTELVLPPQLDLARFPIVDVSIEPYDGDPTHSGSSIWRGALES